MKIIFVSCNHAPGPSGADISAQNLLVGLHRRGFEVRVLTDERNRDVVTDRWRDGIKFDYTSEIALKDALRRTNSRFKADAIFTQSQWAIETIKFGNREKVPTVLFVRSIKPPRHLVLGPGCWPSLFVANSPATAAFVRRVWGRDSLILCPLINSEECIPLYPAQAPENITMINPVKEKGGNLFRDIAEVMPDRTFCAVRGWKTLYGVPPKYIPLTLPNVTVCGPFDDMRSVYANTRLLLVPSLWEEAFGRVAVEAMMNGIPVVASDRGALPWVVGKGGSVLSSRDPNVWATEIRSYDHPRKYAAVSRWALHRASFFDMDSQVERFIGDLSAALNLIGTKHMLPTPAPFRSGVDDTR